MLQRRTVLQAALFAALSAGRARAESAPLRLAVFPDYNVASVLEDFSRRYGSAVTLHQFDSNEDLLAACVAGAEFDVLTLSHYMVPHFAALGLLRPLSANVLASLQPGNWLPRLARFGQIEQRWLAVPKNYGSTGFIYRASKMPALTSWRQFWDTISGPASRRASVIEDVQSLIGAALRYHGHSLNSTRPSELLQAETVLKKARPHLRAMTAEVDDAVLKGDWLAMAWSDSGYWLSQDDPDLHYVNPADGGELWCDFYAVTNHCPRPDVAEQLLEWLLHPAQIAQEVVALGVSPVDTRVLALLPEGVRQNPIIFPPEPFLANAEMSSQEALREPLRSEIFARFAASFR